MKDDRLSLLGKQIWNEQEKNKGTSIIVEIQLLPKDIWEIAKELEYTDYYRPYFAELEQGVRIEMWYRGAKLIRREP